MLINYFVFTEPKTAQNDRLQVVKEMAKSAWKAYKQFALGKEALAPLTNSSIGGDTGKSVIAALGTLKVMGLDEEFNEGRQWLASGNNWKFESLPNQAFFDEVSEFL